jgi:hypothetical protein
MSTFEQACEDRKSATIKDLQFLQEESYESLDTFKKMAEFGLLTTNSQEGREFRVVNQHVDDSLYYDVSSMDHIDWHSKAEFEAMHNKYLEEYVRRGGVCDDGTKYEKAYLAGFMLRDRALKVVDTFNMSDKVAFVVDETDDAHSGYMIPVTFTRFDSGKLLCHTSVCKRDACGQMEFEIETETDLDKSEIDRLSSVVFIDPKPGRLALGTDGLYADVIKALERV